ncbi:MAG: hypothetical protein R3208_19695 [Ketobacteraceae bacterium]|nr:hypothetical protein [Ketobacteraceae bacterium]
MLIHLFRSSVLLFFLSLLAACGGDYQIIDPPKGTVTDTPPEITVAYKERPEIMPTVMLNGNDITALFNMAGAQASARGDAIAEYLVQGTNAIEVRSDPTVARQFIYDTEPPKVVVQSAQRGSLVAIRGRVVDDAGADALRVNGLEVAVDGKGNFVAEVTPADRYLFSVEDRLGYASEIEYRDYRLLYDDSLKARVNQSGLDFITRELVGLVNALDFNELIGGTELYKSGIFRGELTSIDLYADSFNMDPQSGNDLALTGIFKDVRVKLRLVNIIVIKPTMNVDTVRMTGNVLVGVSEGNPDIVITDLNVDLQNVSFEGAMGGFDKFLGGLISGLVERFEGRIGNAIKGQVNDLLSRQLAELIPSTYELELSGKRLQMHFNLKDISTNDNSLFVGLSGGVLPLDRNTLIAEPLGPIFTSDALPQPKYEGDLGIAVNTNVINQTLVAAYASGLTHLTLIGDEVSFDLPRFDAALPGTNRLLVNPSSAPFIQLQEEGGQSSTTLDIRNLEILSQTRREGAWRQDFAVELDTSVEINVDINEDSTLAIHFVSQPRIDLLDITIGTGLTIPPEFVENLVRDEIPGIMDQVSQSLSGIRLPQLAGYILTADDFHPLGANKTHAGLTASLSLAPLPDNIKMLALLGAHGKYFVAEGNGGGTVNANRNSIGTWETFRMNAANDDCILDGSRVTLKTGGGYYFSAQDNGALDANRRDAQSWEHFTLINHSDAAGCLEDGDTVSLRSAHGKYVVAEEDGKARADRDSIGPWERLRVVFQ